MPFTILQLVHIDETGDSYYRMRWPAREVAAQDNDLRVINLDARAQERYEWARQADLLVLYQSNDIDLLPILLERRKNGKRTLVEYNDNFYASPAWSPVAKEWSSPLLWQTYELFMQESDGIIVTGPGLQNLFAKKFPQIPLHVLENHFPRALKPFDSMWPSTAQEIRLGWAGSLGHMADLLAVLPVIREVFNQVPQMYLHIMGNDSIPEFLGIDPQRVRYTNWGSMEQYYSFWEQCHLGIAPLLNTEYNQCRSDIKAVEMAGCAVLPLVSEALPYQTFLQCTALPSAKAFTDFKQLILHYVSNLESLRNDTLRAYTYVSSSRIGPQHTERLTLYRSLLPKLPTPSIWNFLGGYHEVKGSPSSTPLYAKQLAEAQVLVNQGQRQQALAKLSAARLNNPLNFELCLAETKCQRALKNPEFSRAIKQAKKLFPRDLRFWVLEIGSYQDHNMRSILWEELLTHLKSLSNSEQSFFAPEIGSMLAGDLKQNIQLLALASETLHLFPQHAALRLSIAEVLERNGRWSEALEHFNWLEQHTKLAHQNQQFFQNVQLGYFHAWRDALQARISNSKS